MIKMNFESAAFRREMNNIMEYAYGFLDGGKQGKNQFLHSIGPDIVNLANQFIDTNARVSPQTLHHVYEWYRTGSPDARLYDIQYTVSNIGLSFISNFKQSATLQSGSNEPFKNKAPIMENGQSVTIRPRNAEALAFEVDGEMVYTKGDVVVTNPGGQTQGQYEQVFDIFFKKYFSQSFLRTSGLDVYFKNPTTFKRNLREGKRMGRGAGLRTGYRWVANAKVVA